MVFWPLKSLLKLSHFIQHCMDQNMSSHFLNLMTG